MIFKNNINYLAIIILLVGLFLPIIALAFTSGYRSQGFFASLPSMYIEIGKIHIPEKKEQSYNARSDRYEEIITKPASEEPIRLPYKYFWVSGVCLIFSGLILLVIQHRKRF